MDDKKLKLKIVSLDRVPELFGTIVTTQGHVQGHDKGHDKRHDSCRVPDSCP